MANVWTLACIAFHSEALDVHAVWYDVAKALENSNICSALDIAYKTDLSIRILNFGSLYLICDKHHNPIPKIFFLESWNNSSPENQCKNLRCLNQVSWHLIIPTLLHSNLKRHPRENLKKRKYSRLRKHNLLFLPSRLLWFQNLRAITSSYSH